MHSFHSIMHAHQGSENPLDVRQVSVAQYHERLLIDGRHMFLAWNKAVAWGKQVRRPFGDTEAAEGDSMNSATEERLHMVAQIYQRVNKER
jgi:hypothetical protein